MMAPCRGRGAEQPPRGMLHQGETPGAMGNLRRKGGQVGSLWPFKTDQRQVKPGREMVEACVKEQAQPYLA